MSQPVDCTYNLWILLLLTTEAIRKLRTQELGRLGDKAAQATVLYVVDIIGDKATPSEIARWLFRKRNSVQAIVQRMEKVGLVKLTKDTKRRNLVRVNLTEKGRTALKRMSVRQSIDSTFGVLSEEQRSELRALLETMRCKALVSLGITGKPHLPVW